MLSDILKVSKTTSSIMTVHAILSRNHSIHSLDVGTTTYICDFHREQCWERWLRKVDNGLTEHREEVIQLLRGISKSPTEDS